MTTLPSYTESTPAPAPIPQSPAPRTRTDSHAPSKPDTYYGPFAPSYAAATADEELPGYTRRAASTASGTAYRGAYASEEAYLAALRKWASSKQYYQPGELSHDGDNGLVGFYGPTTLEEYAARPTLAAEIRQRRDERRATVAAITGARGQSDELDRARTSEAGKERRKSRVLGLFSRRA